MLQDANLWILFMLKSTFNTRRSADYPHRINSGLVRLQSDSLSLSNVRPVSVSFLPQYSSAGCLLTLHHSEKPDHEEVCEFRPYTCPCPGATCKWHGSLEAVMPHLMHSHKSITTLQVGNTTFQPLYYITRHLYRET